MQMIVVKPAYSTVLHERRDVERLEHVVVVDRGEAELRQPDDVDRAERVHDHQSHGDHEQGGQDQTRPATGTARPTSATASSCSCPQGLHAFSVYASAQAMTCDQERFQSASLAPVGLTFQLPLALKIDLL